MQAEIIHKERKINDLERKLRQREDECERLKQERDRLVSISNELRGELNIAQRRLLENAEETLGINNDEIIERMNERIEEQAQQIEGMDRYIDELDGEIRAWINEQEGAAGVPHRRNEGVRVGGGGKIDKRKS